MPRLGRYFLGEVGWLFVDKITNKRPYRRWEIQVRGRGGWAGLDSRAGCGDLGTWDFSASTPPSHRTSTIHNPTLQPFFSPYEAFLIEKVHLINCPQTYWLIDCHFDLEGREENSFSFLFLLTFCIATLRMPLHWSPPIVKMVSISLPLESLKSPTNKVTKWPTSLYVPNHDRPVAVNLLPLFTLYACMVLHW